MCKKCEELAANGGIDPDPEFEEAKRKLPEVEYNFLARTLAFTAEMLHEQPMSGPYAMARAHAIALGGILGKSPAPDQRGDAFLLAMKHIQAAMNAAMAGEGELKISVRTDDDFSAEFTVRSPSMH